MLILFSLPSHIELQLGRISTHRAMNKKCTCNTLSRPSITVPSVMCGDANAICKKKKKTIKNTQKLIHKIDEQARALAHRAYWMTIRVILKFGHSTTSMQCAPLSATEQNDDEHDVDDGVGRGSGWCGAGNNDNKRHLSIGLWLMCRKNGDALSRCDCFSSLLFFLVCNFVISLTNLLYPFRLGFETNLHWMCVCVRAF